MKNHSSNRNRSSLLIIAITAILMIGCSKRSSDEKYGLQSQTARRTPTLQVQSRGQHASPITLPINNDARDMPILSPIATIALADSSFVEEALANRIFQDVLSQGEKLWDKYFKEGQFAYANSIRRYIEKKYPVKCQKLFAFGDLTATSLQHGCSASWKYDVACVLRGKGGAVYVLDPRLFSSIVSCDKWIAYHLYPTVSEQKPRLNSQALVAGEAFTPLDMMPSGYQMDADYVFTDIMIAHYADSVSCNSNLLQ